jgi:hypothetical protein
VAGPDFTGAVRTSPIGGEAPRRSVIQSGRVVEDDVAVPRAGEDLELVVGLAEARLRGRRVAHRPLPAPTVHLDGGALSAARRRAEPSAASAMTPPFGVVVHSFEPGSARMLIPPGER